MASDVPGHLQSLRPDVQEAAREAARRSGITVEQWLESVILGSTGAGGAPLGRAPEVRSAADDAGHAGPQSAGSARPMREPEQLDAVHARLDALAARLDQMILSPPSQTAPGRDPEMASVLRTIEERLATLGEGAAQRPYHRTRSSRLDGRPSAQFAAGRSRASGSAGSGLDSAAVELDRAIAEIQERQRALDPLTREAADESFAGAASENDDQLASGLVAETADLQDQLRALTQELQSLRDSGGFPETLLALRQELADIGRKLDDVAPRQALNALESDVRQLTERVDRSRMPGADAEALAGIERGLAEVREALHQLAPAESLTAVREQVAALAEKIDAMAAGETDRLAVQQLESAVADVRAIAARAASGEALGALAEEVQEIERKLDRLANPGELGSEVLARIDDRFGEIASRLDASQAGIPAGVTENLLNLVESLATKLEQADLGEKSPVLDGIIGRLAELTDRIEASDARVENLQALERGLHELLAAVEGLRSSALQVAERAVKDAPLGGGQSTEPAAAEVDALKQNIDALRQEQARREQRTQNTLEAVHETLERLVDRLALVESTIRSEDEGPGEGEDVQPLRSLERVETPVVLPGRPAPHIQHGTAARAEPGRYTTAGGERRAFDPTLPADHPLEPGTGNPARNFASAEEPVADDAAAPAKPVSPTEAKSNFIAAARRAAQAAASVSSTDKVPANDEKPTSSAFRAFAEKLAGRRTLLLGLLLLVGASALHFALNGWPARQQRTPGEPATTHALVAPSTKTDAPQSSRAAAPASDAAKPTSPSPAGDGEGERPSGTSGPRSEAAESPAISPLTIAAMQLPMTEATGGVNRTSAASRNAAAAAPAPSAEAPASPAPSGPSQALRAAATAGNPAAAYELASHYAEGRGVAVNFEEAARWFERAAKHGLAPAQYRLGSLYEKGQGVKKDVARARSLYRSASDKGNGKAMHNLAVLYAEGADGKPDFKNAAQWFQRAAERGIADSQYNLGILYARGLGVEQNLAQSYTWFALAAQQGDADASKKRDDVAARLDPEALKTAQAAVTEFKTTPQPDEAVTVRIPAEGWEKLATVAPPAPAKSKPAAAPKPASR